MQEKRLGTSLTEQNRGSIPNPVGGSNPAEAPSQTTLLLQVFHVHPFTSLQE